MDPVAVKQEKEEEGMSDAQLRRCFGGGGGDPEQHRLKTEAAGSGVKSEFLQQAGSGGDPSSWEDMLQRYRAQVELSKTLATELEKARAAADGNVDVQKRLDSVSLRLKMTESEMQLSRAEVGALSLRVEAERKGRLEAERANVAWRKRCDEMDRMRARTRADAKREKEKYESEIRILKELFNAVSGEDSEEVKMLRSQVETERTLKEREKAAAEEVQAENRRLQDLLDEMSDRFERLEDRLHNENVSSSKLESQLKLARLQTSSAESKMASMETEKNRQIECLEEKLSKESESREKAESSAEEARARVRLLREKGRRRRDDEARRAQNEIETMKERVSKLDEVSAALREDVQVKEMEVKLLESVQDDDDDHRSADISRMTKRDQNPDIFAAKSETGIDARRLSRNRSRSPLRGSPSSTAAGSSPSDRRKRRPSRRDSTLTEDASSTSPSPSAALPSSGRKVVLKNLPEQKSGDDEFGQVKKLMQSSCKVVLSERDVTKVKRLGKKGDDGENRRRPLVVTFKSVSLAERVLESSRETAGLLEGGVRVERPKLQ